MGAPFTNRDRFPKAEHVPRLSYRRMLSSPPRSKPLKERKRELVRKLARKESA